MPVSALKTACLSLCLSLFALPAMAQDITDSMTGGQIAAMLEEAGLSVQMMKDKDQGTPVAFGQVGSINFVVRALECRGAPSRCSQLLFFANFNLGRAVSDEDYRIVNSFNDSNVDGRAYVIEESGEIGVDFYIDLTGGVTSAHIENRMGRWQNVISDFIQEMRAAQTGS